MTASARTLASRLLEWYRRARRDLPWRGTKDPYRIWVSEVMLQQTRVSAVVPRYEAFLERYPSVEALAAADVEDLLASWAGLGYYRRARMLSDAARRIVREHGGSLPRSHGRLRELPGIGDYTASAVASIAFDEPTPALDGNALRVLARLANERRPVLAGAGRAAVRQLAESLMAAVPKGSRGDFTQALIELGATLCTPGAPRCGACPWQASCAALSAGSVETVPSRPARRAPKRLHICAGLAVAGQDILLRQRPADSGVMPGFWELPQALGGRGDLRETGLAVPCDGRPLATFRHAITDSIFTVRVYEARPGPSSARACQWVTLAAARELPLSTITTKALARCPGGVLGAKLPAGRDQS
ncbi:MAG: A/G-specific adenine glycosylase [Bryobacterales bacterium]|nr:A/G-specific adenine glycosylase [Bryobacterales bacterium]